MSSTDDIYSEDENSRGYRVMRSRRGRPRGNVRPMDPAQRRQRSTELERVRRYEMAEAYHDLQEAMLDVTNNNEDGHRVELTRVRLLEKTINYIKDRSMMLEQILWQNNQLEKSIRKLEDDERRKKDQNNPKNNLKRPINHQG